jgi:hypothetical protein
MQSKRRSDFAALKNLALELILALTNLPATRSLRSSDNRGTLSGNLERLASVIDTDDFDVTSTISLVTHAINKAPDAII